MRSLLLTISLLTVIPMSGQTLTDFKIIADLVVQSDLFREETNKYPALECPSRLHRYMWEDSVDRPVLNFPLELEYSEKDCGRLSIIIEERKAGRKYHIRISVSHARHTLPGNTGCLLHTAAFYEARLKMKDGNFELYRIKITSRQGLLKTL